MVAFDLQCLVVLEADFKINRGVTFDLQAEQHDGSEPGTGVVGFTDICKKGLSGCKSEKGTDFFLKEISSLFAASGRSA
ncbi:hypothetical protein C5612_01285 [Pseudomonas frederiksbergensis]|uniref:Uncharacterized protein n=1 Tax=Pseudomonas frederiksbergensis TaxID=104087 RepID=A0A2S8HV59_9PSED|nr:hypothetical protein C5612_01285 [Pseudomonas frederiksbergensis]